MPRIVASRLALVLLAVCLTAMGCRSAGDPERGNTPVTPVALPKLATAGTAAPTVAEVVIGGVSFEAELAVDPAERAKGLSGRASLPPKTGMLFVFEGPRTSNFWMKEMRFPLDFIWIGEDCTVVDMTREVPPPAPGTSPADLPRYSPASPAAYNFEINAGEAARHGIAVGAAVRFRGMPDGVESPCG